jgi:hypothetical protein
MFVERGVVRVLVDPTGAAVWDVFEVPGKVRVESLKGGSAKLAAGGHANVDKTGLLSPAEFVYSGHSAPEEPHFAGERPAPVKKL